MADISDTKWSELDPSNNSASPDGIQGSYAPNTVAPILRATRGAIKRDYVQSNPIYTSTGTSTAYVLTYAQAPAPITKGKKFVFWAHVTSAGAATLNVNAQGAKSLLRPDGSALLLGDIQASTVVIAHYDGAAFRITNPAFTEIGRVSGNILDARLPTTQTGKTFTSATTISGDILSVDDDTSPQIYLRKKTGTINRGQISANIAGSAVTIQTYNAAGVATQKLDIPETGNMQFAGATVWTAANDGDGSTLDADLLDGYHATALPVSTPQQTALDLKANLASPALTGTPTAPTATAESDSTQLATTAFVKTAVTAIPGFPAGFIVIGAMSTPPTGWLKCNGAAVSRTTYADLFDALVTNAGYTLEDFTVTIASALFAKTAHGFVGGERLRLSTTGALPTGLNTTSDYFVISVDANNFRLATSQANQQADVFVSTSGTQSGTHSYLRSDWGLGDGTTFNLPDLRGVFARGSDDGRGLDAARALGSLQTDAMQQISGSIGGVLAGSSTGPFFRGAATDSWSRGGGSGTATSVSVSMDSSRQVRTATETRPVNVNVNYFIKT
ncbi:phage tail protein [Neorhizobium sp. T7_12]|uniref:phage tail protein n=1 Tax=Neorhizobium sp. T7_12 TaxID=2093832 RepID=UPI000CF9FD2D|nr:phage tail protein [Neorhizobium sp. T7_12]